MGLALGTSRPSWSRGGGGGVGAKRRQNPRRLGGGGGGGLKVSAKWHYPRARGGGVPEPRAPWPGPAPCAVRRRGMHRPLPQGRRPSAVRGLPLHRGWGRGGTRDGSPPPPKHPVPTGLRMRVHPPGLPPPPPGVRHGGGNRTLDVRSAQRAPFQPPISGARCPPPPPRPLRRPLAAALLVPYVAQETDGGRGTSGCQQTCIGEGERHLPPPLEGAQPMPSHCPPDANCQPQWHL